ncbi:uncharacterized protein LOC124160288 [Ischnura elegans]|uniref:uncharacterized protein LOC124160288 n=1 Tax=Ischnura elegans TaxID=197161 RepID=UPI001ED887F0|nr:uncharacterized protein LOC124160288 [Ischnura elegans]
MLEILYLLDNLRSYALLLLRCCVIAVIYLGMECLRNRGGYKPQAMRAIRPAAAGGEPIKPYADHCHCQSCSEVRQQLVTGVSEGPPPVAAPLSSNSGGDDIERYASHASEEVEDPDEMGNDFLEEPEDEEEDETDGHNELRVIPSTYSLLASDPAASRRPVICPMKPCSRHIAVHTLVSHFRFEHPEVPMIVLSPDSPTATIPLAPMHYLSPLDTECAAILRVSWKDDDDKVQLDAWKLVLAYAVMPDGGLAAWVFGLLEGDQEIMAKLEMSTWISGESAGAVDAGNMSAYDLFCKEGSETSSTFLGRSASYMGPVVPLRELQEAQNILARGDCLYLTPGLAALFTSAPQGAFIQVTFIF